MRTVQTLTDFWSAFNQRSVLFPNQYAWYVLVCFLDLIMTNTILVRFGGIEVNALAHRIVEQGGFWGLIAFKCLSITIVILICEYIGSRRSVTGRRVAEWAVAISAIPVILGLLQLAIFLPPIEQGALESQPKAVLLTWFM